ncbi:MAG: hypothetical protein C5B50_27325 [Verrucomicrobia bacterium]|nr:MAG: hypothetical protein C5B50_27325 [Verrucomicrobiota bacterium]
MNMKSPMRKQFNSLVTIASLALLASFNAGAQSAFFQAVTNLNPLGYWPLTETNAPPGSKPAAANSGTLGGADNGLYKDGAFPGVKGALAGDSDSAALFSGASGFNPLMQVPYDPAYATASAFTIEFWVNSPLDPGFVYAATYAPDYACPVACMDTASPNAGWLIYEGLNGTPGTFNFQTFNHNGTTPSLNMQMPVPPALLDGNGNMRSNTWYHVAVTFNGANAIGYINGQQVATGTATGGYVPSTGGGLSIGNRSDGGFVFQGYMDEVAFYSNVLSGSDILAHYMAGTNPAPATAYQTLVANDHPQLYYRLDDASAPVANSYGTLGSFLNGYYETGITPGVAGPSFSGLGANSYACSFSGAGNASVNILNVAGLLGLGDADGLVSAPTASVSVSAWVQVPNGSVSGFQNVLGAGDVLFRFAEDPAGIGHFAEGFNGGDAVANLGLNDGQWHFWVGTWDKNSKTESLYVDGRLVGTGTQPNGGPGGQPFLVGTAPDYNNRHFFGSVAHLALFGNLLSPAQIQNLYNAAGAPPVITAQPQPTVVMQGSNVSITVTAGGAPTLTYQWYTGTPGSGTPVSGGNISGAATSTLTFTAAQPANNAEYYVVVTNPGGSTTSVGVNLSVLTTALAGNYFPSIIKLNPLGYWPLSENTLPPPSDIAANYGTLGAAGNAACSSTVLHQWSGSGPGLTPDGDTGIFMDGSAAVVTLPFSPVLSLNAPFSAEAWLLANNTGATQCPLACMDAGNPRSGWLIYMDGVNPGSYNLRFYNRNGTAPSLSISSPANGINGGQWYHVVAVYDGTTAYLYVNGQLAVSAAPSGFVANDAGALTIGARSDDSFFFNGGEDEVAIYTNALSAATVLAHYQTGTNNASPGTAYQTLVLQSHPLIYYRLDEPAYTAPPETSDPVAHNYGALGSSDNGYYLPGSFPGTVPGPRVAGFPISTACRFNSAFAGYVDVPVDSNNGLNVVGPVTLTAWVQGSPADNRFQSMAGRGDTSYRFGLEGNGRAHFADGNDGNGDVVGGGINDGNWHFLVGVWDGFNQLIYIDGALSQSQADSVGIPGNGANFVMGGVPDYLPGRIFNGNVSQVAVFGAALSAPQIQSLFYSAQVLPYITNQPVSTVVAQGNTATLSVGANGTPSLGYQWYKGTTPVSNAGDFSGANTATLTVSTAQTPDSGSFKVVITNSFGSVTSSVATLLVTPSPYIVSQPSPTNITLYAGNAVSYNLGVVGNAPLSFQWYSGASAIGGATSSNLTFASTVGTNHFFCIVTNSYGAVTSIVTTVVAQLFVAPATGFVLNFAAPPNGTAADVYSGPGAYNDNPANLNTNWNPYAPGSGTATAAATNTAGGVTLITSTLNFGFNNTGVTPTPPGSPPNGDPTYLVGTEDAVNGGAPGIGTSSNPMGQFIVNNLPRGTYSLYVYAENYDGDRGSVIALAPANHGAPDHGIYATTNGIVNGLNAPHSHANLVEGDNYVFFHQVVPDVLGTISGTYIPNPNPISGNNGEAPFNGLQLVLNTLSIVKGAGATVTVTWTGGVLYSAPSLSGPWNPVGGSSPQNLPASGSAQYFLVW